MIIYAACTVKKAGRGKKHKFNQSDIVSSYFNQLWLFVFFLREQKKFSNIVKTSLGLDTDSQLVAAWICVSYNKASKSIFDMNEIVMDAKKIKGWLRRDVWMENNIH